MRCPYCREQDSRVLDSREVEDGAAIRRRRRCGGCGRRYSTLETAALAVRKRSGALEPFSREKVLAGVRKACEGRPVGSDRLALLAQEVEDAVRAHGLAEVPAQAVGRAVLEPLRALDVVAYLRFASVYRSFASLEDFAQEVERLRLGADTPGGDGPVADPPSSADPPVHRTRAPAPAPSTAPTPEEQPA